MDNPAQLRQTFPTSAARQVLTTSRGTFAALVAGSGEQDQPLALLVPGYTGSKEDFAAILDPLAERGFTVYAIDQRGQFESPAAAEPNGYSVQELAADLLSIVKEIGSGRPVHLLGHSFGGLVSRQAVISAPEEFGSLTLLASGPGALGGQRAAALRAVTPLFDQLGQEGVYQAGVEMAERDPEYTAPPGPLADFLRRRFLDTDAGALIHMGAAMLNEPDRVAELKATGVPVLVAYSPGDNAWTPDSQAEMAARLGATEVTIPDAAHSPALENAEQTIEVLAKFWAGVSAPDDRR